MRNKLKKSTARAYSSGLSKILTFQEDSRLYNRDLNISELLSRNNCKKINRSSIEHLQKIKYTIIGLSALFLTIIEIYYYTHGVPILNDIIEWLIGMAGAVILIELTFRSVAKLQKRLEMEINERKKSEEELLRVNDVLRLLNKNLRHDILNDLSVVNGALEMYSEKKDEKLLKYAKKAIERSIDLTKRIRDLESLVLSGRNLKPVNVRKIIEEVISNYKNEYQVEFSIDGNCTVIADDGLSSVIENIIRNAINHGGASKIEIKLEESESCRIIIADNGRGIPQEIKEKIFDEGFSYGDNKGSGLGLYIVKKTIERYGGSIQIKDNKPYGTVFIITLSCPNSSVPE